MDYIKLQEEASFNTTQRELITTGRQIVRELNSLRSELSWVGNALERNNKLLIDANIKNKPRHYTLITMLELLLATGIWLILLRLAYKYFIG